MGWFVKCCMFPSVLAVNTDFPPPLLNAVLELSVQTDLHGYMKKANFHSASWQTTYFASQAC